MRAVEFNGKAIYIQANTLSSFFYKQQFNKDLLEDGFRWLSGNETSVGSRIVWALSKSHDFELLDYDQWLVFFEKGKTDWEAVQLELMKLFVAPKDSNKSKSSVITEDYETKLIVSANRAGISLDLMKILLPHELINALETNTENKASQEDIDRLLS